MSSTTTLQAPAPPRKKVTIPALMKKMREGEAIVQMAVYDFRSAVVADRLGIDILCVSDTGGMILFGHRSTVTVSFEEVMFMAQAVDRGSRHGLRMGVIPIWPCTGMPALTIASMLRTWWRLPSHFMTSAFARATNLPAFSTACSGEM